MEMTKELFDILNPHNYSCEEEESYLQDPPFKGREDPFRGTMFFTESSIARSQWFKSGEADKMPGGYHPRIFLNGYVSLHDDSPSTAAIKVAQDFLKSQCLWGGSDKIWGKYAGYEIHSSKFDLVCAKLQEMLGLPLTAKQVATLSF